MACQDDQLCAGLKVGIYDTIHGVQALWDKNLTTEEWVFLLVDAKIVFNDINQVGMLWTVQHLWPSGSIFFFNFYRHWSSFILRNGNGTAIIIHSREGMAQGYPLTMIAYGIGIIPLIKNLKQEIPDVTQPCYADDAGVLGTFRDTRDLFLFADTPGPGPGVSP